MDDPVAVVRELAAADVSACGALELDRVLGLVRRVEGWLATVAADATRRAAELHAVGRGRRPESTLERVAGLSKHAAHAAVARSATLQATPPFADALAAGDIAAAHVDAFARAVERSPVLARHAGTLVAAAARTTPAEFARHCQDVAVVNEPGADALARFERQQRDTRLHRWIDEATGMYRLTASFDPVTGERLWSALDVAIEKRFHDRVPPTAPDDPKARPAHLAGLALAELATSGRIADGRPAAATVLCLIDHETLLEGLHDRSRIELEHGGRIPVEIVRQLACDAGILPVVLGGDGVVLDMGRSRRLASPEQRLALRAMYPTCAVPGCTTGFTSCTVHHVDFWGRDDGETNLGSQAPLCTVHHGDVHAGRIAIELVPSTRAITVRARDGTVLARADGPPGRSAA